MKRIDNAIYEIRKKYLSRYDADGDKKPKKKPTGWSTKLPYGLCEDLGIDTTGMLPHEAWEAYETHTGASVDDVYEEKAEKGEGDVIDVEEEISDKAVSDISSMTKKELKKKSKDLQNQIDKLQELAWADDLPWEDVEKYGDMIEELEKQKEEIDNAIESAPEEIVKPVTKMPPVEEELPVEEPKAEEDTPAEEPTAEEEPPVEEDVPEETSEATPEAGAEEETPEEEIPDEGAEEPVSEESPAEEEAAAEETVEEETPADEPIAETLDEPPVTETPAKDYSSMTSEELEAELGDLDAELESYGEMPFGFEDIVAGLEAKKEKVEEELAKKKETESVGEETASESASEGAEEPAVETTETAEEYHPEHELEDLENNILGGSISEFLEAGGFQDNGYDTFYNPLTAEEFSKDFKEAVEKEIAYYQKAKAAAAPEPAAAEPTATEPHSKEELDKLIADADGDIWTFTNILKDFGFSEEDIANGKVGEAIEKAELAGQWYDTVHDIKDYKKEACESHGHDASDTDWFYDEYLAKNPDKQKEWDDLYLAKSKTQDQLMKHGVYDFSTLDASIGSMPESDVEKILEKKDMAEYYNGLLKAAKADKAKYKAESEALSTPTDTVESLKKSIADGDEIISDLDTDLKDITGKSYDEIVSGGGTDEIYKAAGLAKKYYDALEEYSKASFGSEGESKAYDKMDALAKELGALGYKQTAMFTLKGMSSAEADEKLSEKAKADQHISKIKALKDEKAEKQAKLKELGVEVEEPEATSAPAETGSVSESEATPATGGGPETETPAASTPKKSPTIKFLEKKIAQTDKDIEAEKTKTYKVGDVEHSYNDFVGYAESGVIEGVKTVDDIFDRADKLNALYDAIDKRDEYKAKNGGKTPEEAYLAKEITYGKWLIQKKEYKKLEDAVTAAQDELSKYKLTFDSDGKCTSATKDMVGKQLAWKDFIKTQGEKVKALEAGKADLTEQLEIKKAKAKITSLTKQKTALAKKAKEIENELSAMPDKTYTGIWKTPVKTSDYEKLNIEGKKQYYNEQLAKLGEGTTDAEKAKVAQFKGYLENLAELETEGKAYAEKSKSLAEAKNAVAEKAEEIKALKMPKTVDTPGTPFTEEAYTKERKDKALWAKTSKAADNALWDKCSDVWLGASKEEKDAIYKYTHTYSRYNEPLRGINYGTGVYVGKDNIDFEKIGASKGLPKGEVKKEINAITSILDKSSYDHDMWLERGVRSDEHTARFLGISESLLKYGSEKELQDKLLGKELIENAFCSTGAAKGKGFGGSVKLNIYAPAGTKMMYVEPFSYYGTYDKAHPKHHEMKPHWDGKTHATSVSGEVEVLIQRGTKFRVTRVEKSGSEVYLDVEIIAQDPEEI